MKKVLSYTAGWDAKNSLGYLTVVDDEDESHLLGKLEGADFRMLLRLLKEEKEVFIDKNNWLVSGWNPDDQ